MSARNGQILRRHFTAYAIAQLRDWILGSCASTRHLWHFVPPPKG
ncbi:hypothetical protein [Paenibacillus sp. Soil750]|nr:hypothetical protein [Paenibacillus sp. Soil750]